MSFFFELWHSVPPITRTILIISVILSLLVTLELCTPYKLYFNIYLIKNKFQYWRIFTCLFYYGELSARTVFDFMLFYWYASKLEQHDFRNKPADLIIFFMFGCTLLLMIATFICNNFSALLLPRRNFGGSFYRFGDIVHPPTSTTLKSYCSSNWSASIFPWYLSIIPW